MMDFIFVVLIAMLFTLLLPKDCRVRHRLAFLFAVTLCGYIAVKSGKAIEVAKDQARPSVWDIEIAAFACGVAAADRAEYPGHCVRFKELRIR